MTCAQELPQILDSFVKEAAAVGATLGRAIVAAALVKKIRHLRVEYQHVQYVGAGGMRSPQRGVVVQSVFVQEDREKD